MNSRACEAVLDVPLARGALVANQVKHPFSAVASCSFTTHRPLVLESTHPTVTNTMIHVYTFLLILEADVTFCARAR